MESFSALLRRGRAATGLGYQRIAELVGRSPATIRNWERGKSRPIDPEVVVALAAVLDISEEELLSAAGLAVESPAGAFADLVPSDLGQDALEEEKTEDVLDESASDVPEPEELLDQSLPAAAAIATSVEPETGHEEQLAWDTSEPEPALPRPAEEVETVVAAEPEIVSEGTQGASRLASHRPVPPAPRPAVLVPPTVATTEPSYLEDGRQMMTYRVRAALTVAVGALLLLFLEWGLRGLGASLKGILGGLGP
ncbi:MAG: helix-turn-helix domain-containing protein [Actinobacteria bacterium]|nr:helix-turn-helix domain-containing protein [Actinomycetota bacterium]